MTIVDIITELCCRVDAAMTDVPQHSQQALAPSELVTIGLLYAFKGVGRLILLSRAERQLPRSVPRAAQPHPALPPPAHTSGRDGPFPGGTQHDGRHRQLWHRVDPSVPGQPKCSADRQERAFHHRWIVGGKLCLMRDHLGQVVVWACDTAHVHDTQFHPLIAPYEGQTLVLGDGGFHRARGDASHFKRCRRGECMQVETVLSMLTGMCCMKPMRHRVWAYFRAHLAYLMAAFNILVPWHGLEPDAHGRVRLAIAQFTL